MSRFLIVFVALLLIDCGGREIVHGVGDAVATADVGDPAWSTCPQAWPPSPPLVFCGSVSGIFCYEIAAQGVVLTDEGVKPLLPCRGYNEVVLLPMGDVDCAACTAIGARR